MKISLLDKLTAVGGISGDENAVAQTIIKEIDGHCRWELDPLGNLLVWKEGKKERETPLLLCAHMDEVGLMVSHITDEGYLRFVTIGGIDSRVLPGRQVMVGKEGLRGVIGCKAVHQTSDEERGKAVPADKLLIDIGASGREEAESMVQVGDSVTFISDFERLGGRRIKGKAIDDRFGCAVLIQLIRSELPYSTMFAFTVQEEIGSAGAQTAAFRTKPGRAVIIESTSAGDLPGVSAPKDCCGLGRGAVVPFMDKGTLYDRTFYKEVLALAREKGIPVQTKTVVCGRNDAAPVHVSREGVPSVAVSIPCRYLHTPCCVADEQDMEAVEALVSAIVERE